MGTINIRFRQQALGNLPSVRQVDTSGLSAGAEANAAGARAIARGIDDLVQGGLRLGNVYADLKAEANKNEANRLYKDYVTQMDALTTQAADPNAPLVQEGVSHEGLFLTAERDDNAAKNLSIDLKKGQAAVRKAIGLDKQEARVKELFEEMAFSYDRGNALRADAIMAKRFQTSRLSNATATAELSRQNAIRNMDAASMEAYGKALGDLLDAQGVTGQNERKLAVEKASQEFLAEYLAQQAATDDIGQLVVLQETLRKEDEIAFMPGTDERVKSFMNAEWKKLPADAKEKAILAVEAARNKKYKEVADRVTNLQSEGKLTYARIEEEIDKWRSFGMPEGTLKTFYAARDAQRAKDINTSIIGVPDDITDAPDIQTMNTLLNDYAAKLPPHVRDSNEWKAFEKKARAGYAKAAVSSMKDAYKEEANRIVYGYDAQRNFIPIDVADKKSMLEQMWREGKLDIEDYDKAIAAIEATDDNRCADMAIEAMKAANIFERAGTDGHGAGIPYGIMGSLSASINEDGDLNAGTYMSILGDIFEDSDKTQRRDAFEKFKSGYEHWAQAVKNNPSWTREQCIEMFYAAMRYPIEMLAEGALKMTPAQAQEFQNRLGRLNHLANPYEPMAQGNRDYKFDPAKHFVWGDDKYGQNLVSEPNIKNDGKTDGTTNDKKKED